MTSPPNEKDKSVPAERISRDAQDEATLTADSQPRFRYLDWETICNITLCIVAMIWVFESIIH
jgi:hypothetical protein